MAAAAGAVEALARIRAAGLETVLVTNTTSRTRAEIAELLDRGGFEVEAGSILTAPAATAAYLAEHHPGARCLVLNSGDITEDLGDLELADTDPDVVVLGGAGPEFSYQAVEHAFRYLQQGTPLVAMHRNRYWRTDEGLRLDSGAFVTGLEYAADVRAVLVGKPAPEFFAVALRSACVPAEAAVMVGDDIESDVLGAQHCDITGVLVRTGKYDDATVATAPGSPDHVLDSFADLPTLLGLG
ncbi:MAG TPA: TIGR01458 family HAD-type hydrolase [Pseudonocardiaceae bacterium]|nr:TIGR01458 family HAD-type hydrolase [Pseudonocardiaceae bacterium]